MASLTCLKQSLWELAADVRYPWVRATRRCTGPLLCEPPKNLGTQCRHAAAWTMCALLQGLARR